MMVILRHARLGQEEKGRKMNKTALILITVLLLTIGLCACTAGMVRQESDDYITIGGVEYSIELTELDLAGKRLQDDDIIPLPIW